MTNIQDVLKNLNLFVDGRGYAGQVEEIELPKLTLKTEEFRAGGMDAPIEVEMGMEKLECTFTLNGYNKDVLSLFGLAPGNHKPLTIKGSLLSEDGAERPIQINLRGMLREVDMGSWKPGDKGTLKVMMALSYYKLTHSGQVMIEIDPTNLVRIIDGQDQLQQTRAHLGL